MAIRITLCGTYIKPTGRPARGSVRFTMRPLTVVNATDQTITLNSVVANLDAAGHFEIDLQATDDPDIVPSGTWTYQVEEDVFDGPPRFYDISLPIALVGPDCVSLVDLAPASSGCGEGACGGGNVLPSGFENAVVTAIPASITAVVLDAGNTTRRRLYIFNDSSSVLRVKLGAGASDSDFSFYLPSQGSLELEYPCYTGIVTGIWETADGVAYVTEVTS